MFFLCIVSVYLRFCRAAVRATARGAQQTWFLSRRHRCREGGAARAGEVKNAAARDAERRKREGHRRTLSPVAHRTPEYGCKVGR
jgi:hypothetical protein